MSLEPSGSFLNSIPHAIILLIEQMDTGAKQCARRKRTLRILIVIDAPAIR